MKGLVDRVALTFGVIFLGIAALWLASRLFGLAVVTVGWVVAGGLIVLGLAGIGAALAATRRHADDPHR